jgi:hypothetical protein
VLLISIPLPPVTMTEPVPLMVIGVLLLVNSVELVAVLIVAAFADAAAVATRAVVAASNLREREVMGDNP